MSRHRYPPSVGILPRIQLQAKVVDDSSLVVEEVPGDCLIGRRLLLLLLGLLVFKGIAVWLYARGVLLVRVYAAPRWEPPPPLESLWIRRLLVVVVDGMAPLRRCHPVAAAAFIRLRHVLLYMYLRRRIPTSPAIGVRQDSFECHPQKGKRPRILRRACTLDGRHLLSI